VPYLQREAEAGDKLVVAVGFDFIDALGQVAKQFPNTKFAIIDTPASAIAMFPSFVLLHPRLMSCIYVIPLSFVNSHFLRVV
jgi:hypothetical protein